MTTSDNWRSQTQAIRAGLERSNYQEHCEPIYATSSFVFDNAAQAAARFGNEDPGFMYFRAGNPTVASFQQRLAALEGGQACVAAASGMAAITAALMSLCSSGDHIVAARELFGATTQLFGILERFGIKSTFVPINDLDAWRNAIQSETRVLYLESPSNPLTQVADIGALAQIAKASNTRLIVDNCFCSPAVQQPLTLGADLVIHSATKYLDGQGRINGGAVVGDTETIEQKIVPFLRTTGGVMAPFNAWVALKGLETLAVRMNQHAINANALAQWLEGHRAVDRVYYPGLGSHEQHELALSQQSNGGPILSFTVHGASNDQTRMRAWQVIDACQMLSITANLGDVKTTITHPATTTHLRVEPQVREAAGVGQGLIRIAVGLEDIQDIKDDLSRGLSELS